MNEGYDNTAPWTGGGNVHCRCVEFSFSKQTQFVGRMNKQQALTKNDDESSNIKRSRRQNEKKKRLPDVVCVLIVQWSFQYFNHPRWEGRGDRSCYIAHSPLLYFCAHCASLTFLCSITHLRAFLHRKCSLV